MVPEVLWPVLWAETTGFLHGSALQRHVRSAFSREPRFLAAGNWNCVGERVGVNSHVCPRGTNKG